MQETTLDNILDELELLTQSHPIPMMNHCSYCTTWLTLVELLGASDE